MNDYFKQILTKLELDKIYEMLDSFDQQNEDYFLYAGTLLGCFLFRDILPWDDDVDIGMIDPDLANHKGYQSAGWKDGVKIFDVTMPICAGRNYTFPFLDIIKFHKSDNLLFHNNPWGKKESFNFEDIFPLQKAKFGPLELKIPANPKGVLTKEYGVDCLTYAIPSWWDHRNERKTNYPRIKVPYTEIL